MNTFVRARAQADWSAVRHALRDAAPRPFWLDDPSRPATRPGLEGDLTCDLLVIGGGYTGLWTALLAQQSNPDADIVLAEGGTIGWAASGRNGGFCSASLTHGASNGEAHLPAEASLLERLGLENLDAIEQTVSDLGLDCEFERTGGLDVATEPYQVEELRSQADPESGVRFHDREAVRSLVDSPTFLAGLEDTRGNAMVHPAKLAWELARAAEEAGVRILENTIVRGLREHGDTVRASTDHGTITADRVALGTNAFPSLLKSSALHTVPVYDYALMTEPLNEAQLTSIGWQGRQGLSDIGNQFHYYRLSADHRILWGGYDAVYHYGRRVSPRHDHRPKTYERLAAHFQATFPQLSDVRFTHAWGGAIDTCSRFFSFFDTAMGGKVASVAGYTGLGVAATRFGARVMIDLLAGEETELTRLEMVRRKPLPFPPEPAAWLGVKATTAALVRADSHEGRRGPLLKVLDAVGMGFDS